MNATEERANPSNTMFPWYKAVKVCVLFCKCSYVSGIRRTRCREVLIRKFVIGEAKLIVKRMEFMEHINIIMLN